MLESDCVEPTPTHVENYRNILQEVRENGGTSEVLDEEELDRRADSFNPDDTSSVQMPPSHFAPAAQQTMDTLNDLVQGLNYARTYNSEYFEIIIFFKIEKKMFLFCRGHFVKPLL
jgi:hypothetical protein